MAAFAVPARAASVNVDGLSGPGEWTDAAVLISDLNEAGIPDERDIRSIAIKGGHGLYFAATAYGQSLDMAPLDANPGFSLAFTLGDGGNWRRFELSYGILQPAAERMRLIDVSSGQDLGPVPHAVSETLEVEVPWALVRPGLPGLSAAVQVSDLGFSYRAVSGDITGDGRVSLADLGVIAANWNKSVTGPQEGDLTGDGAVKLADLMVVACNWGGHPYDTFDGAAAIERNLPVATHAPEPLTALGVAAGLAALGGYIRRRRA
jgi:hypothetical protein